MISRLIDFALMALQVLCLKFVELLKSQISIFSIIPGLKGLSKIKKMKKLKTIENFLSL